MAELTGVLYRELSVSGDRMSGGKGRPANCRGESPRSSRRGEYGGGGETTGSEYKYVSSGNVDMRLLLYRPAQQVEQPVPALAGIGLIASYSLAETTS